MLRQSTNAGDPFYDAMVTPGNGITVQYRATAGGSAVQAATLTGAVPVYLKVTRAGNTFTAYTSSNEIGRASCRESGVTTGVAVAVVSSLAHSCHNAGAV